MIEFVKTDIEELDLEIVSTVEELLGRKLGRADPLRIFLRGIELILIQTRELINFVGNQNLLGLRLELLLHHLEYSMRYMQMLTFVKREQNFQIGLLDIFRHIVNFPECV